MIPATFEPTIPGCERPQTDALDRAATGFDMYVALVIHIYVALCTYICVELVISICLAVGVYIGVTIGICVCSSSCSWCSSSYLLYIFIGIYIYVCFSVDTYIFGSEYLYSRSNLCSSKWPCLWPLWTCIFKIGKSGNCNGSRRSLPCLELIDL